MKFDDTLIGIVLGIFSVLVFAIAQTFPPIPGQHFGASLFPTVVSVGLFICAVLLVLQGLSARACGAPRPPRPQWLHEPLSVIRFLLIPASLIFYFETGDLLGFIPCAIILLLVLFRAFGVSWRRTIIVSLISVLVIHFMFYSVLHVPLPWGLLESLSW